MSGNVVRSGVCAFLVVVSLCMAVGALAQEPVSPPTTSADFYLTSPGTTLTVPAPGVLANDSDHAGLPLTAALELGAIHGTLSLSANGSFTYTPEAGFVGSDTFVYRASNGSAESRDVVATVIVTPPAQQGSWTSVSCGGAHTLALRSDGTVWAWGSNGSGQLGDGLPLPSGIMYYRIRSRPLRVVGLTNIVAVSAGYSHSLALDRDGRVWTWGYTNYSPVLSDPLITSTPVQVEGLTGVVGICAGWLCSLALKSDGTVWAWGGENGHLLAFLSPPASGYTPVQVPGITDAVGMAVGQEHVLIVKRDGSVWAWGSNSCGALGDGSTSDRTSPVRVANLSGVKAVAAGWSTSLALLNDGSVYHWGDDMSAPMSGADLTTPVRVSGLPKISAIDAGDSHMLAAAIDGSVWAWGRNECGVLGFGEDGGVVTVPTKVPGVSGITAISARGRCSTVLRNDGSLMAWGVNTDGQLGFAASDDPGPGPVRVCHIDDATKVAVTGTAVLRNDGSVWTWGETVVPWLSPEWERLSVFHSSVPTREVDVTGMTAVISSGRHSVALRSDGTVWGWGDNSMGQLGVGSLYPGHHDMPVQMVGITDAVAIDGDAGRTMIVKGDGTLWGCGSPMSNNLLLDGNTSWRPIPSPAQANITDVRSVTVGLRCTAVIKRDGTAWAWGDNPSGMLGIGYDDGFFMDPMQIVGITGAKAVAFGSGFTLLLKDDGTVWSSGLDAGFGGLQNVPTQVSGLSEVVSIAAYDDNAVALKSDGTVWVWGDNSAGQLGDGTYHRSPTPTQVAGLSGVVSVGLNNGCMIAAKSDGSVWACGSGWHGATGNGRLLHSAIPIPVDSIAGLSDTTPPSTPVVSDRGDKVFASKEFSASWSSNDAESGIAVCMYAIGKSPIDPGSGYVVDWTAVGNATSAVCPGSLFERGQTYYWYVKTMNGAGQWSSVGTSDGIEVIAAKASANEGNVSLYGAVVTAILPDCAYVEAQDRSWGMRVVSLQQWATYGKVNVSGVIRTSDCGERFVDGATLTWAGTGSVQPLFINNRSLGGGGLGFEELTGAGQRGVTLGSGLNNIGLLVKTTGKVKDIGTDFFYIDDGSGIRDGSGYTGVRVLCGSLAKPGSGVVSVTGISSMIKIGDNYCRCLLVRSGDDIVQ